LVPAGGTVEMAIAGSERKKARARREFTKSGARALPRRACQAAVSARL